MSDDDDDAAQCTKIFSHQFTRLLHYIIQNVSCKTQFNHELLAFNSNKRMIYAHPKCSETMHEAPNLIVICVCESKLIDRNYYDFPIRIETAFVAFLFT